MKCLICLKEIKSGEQVFWGNQVEYCGPGEDDCRYSCSSDGLIGGIHLSCLESPAESLKTSGMVVSRRVEENPVVRRSDALAVFGMDE